MLYLVSCKWSIEVLRQFSGKQADQDRIVEQYGFTASLKIFYMHFYWDTKPWEYFVLNKNVCSMYLWASVNSKDLRCLLQTQLITEKNEETREST